MKFALLGVDADTLALGRAVAASAQHELVTACEVEGCQTTLREIEPDITFIDGWELLLLGSVVDAVIVGRGRDDAVREDQLRNLVREGVPLLVVHPVTDSPLIYYELDVLREESGSVLLPCLPDRSHPAVARIRSLVRGEREGVGKVQQITFERALPGPTKAVVLTQLARDIDTLRSVCGEFRRVGALATPGDAAAYGDLGVHLLPGASGVPASWTVRPDDSSPGGTLTLYGDAGRAILTLPNDDRPWSLTETTGDDTSSEQFPDWHREAVALDQFSAAVAGGSDSADWACALRSAELVEAVQRSITKGRTIELRDNDRSEEGTFKGIMTSLGCGLILAGLAVLLLTALAQFVARELGLTATAEAIGTGLPFVLLAVFGMFLVLQVLKLVVRTDEGGDEASESDDDSG